MKNAHDFVAFTLNSKNFRVLDAQTDRSRRVVKDLLYSSSFLYSRDWTLQSLKSREPRFGIFSPAAELAAKATGAGAHSRARPNRGGSAISPNAGELLQEEHKW